jgi:GTP cyclohydrolase I
MRLAHAPGAQGENNLAGRNGVDRLERSSAPALLVSYAYLDPFLKNQSRYCYRDWVLDSGAFTAHASGKPVDLQAYVGEDPGREGLLDTPRRVCSAMDELTAGYHQDPEAILATDFDGNGYDQMVLCRRIEFCSTCEHHLLPFLGVAHVAYVPRRRVVGLSKMARLVDCFARRLQIQEKLTQQVAEAMQRHLKPRGVGVMVEAKHLCMSCRGARKAESEMVTTCLIGAFKRHEVREEFLMQCRGRI